MLIPPKLEATIMLHSPTTDRTPDSATRQPHHALDLDRQPATALGRFPGWRTSPTSPSDHFPSQPLADLHRTYGNQAILRTLRRPTITPDPGHPVQRLCNQCQAELDEDRKPPSALGIQAKLTIGQPGDRYEQEADRVADQVMGLPDSPAPGQQAISSLPQRPQPLQRLCPTCEDELQRQAFDEEEKKEEEEPLQPKAATPGPMPPTPRLERQIQSLQGRGQPLPAATRRFFEARFGYDFGQVRVHADTQAAETARAVRSQAFTKGNHIVFGAGHYAPNSIPGRRLLAHELTHTIQQQAGATRIQRVTDSVVECQRNNSQACLVHLHGDEVEALHVAKCRYCNSCASLVHLTNAPPHANAPRRGCRLLRFEVNTGNQRPTCCVDPNRIFNDALMTIDPSGNWSDGTWKSDWETQWNNSSNSRSHTCGCNPNCGSDTNVIRNAPAAIQAIRNQLVNALGRCRNPQFVGPLPPGETLALQGNPVIGFHGNLPTTALSINAYCGTSGGEREATYRPGFQRRTITDPPINYGGRPLEYNSACTPTSSSTTPIQNPHIDQTSSNRKDFILVTDINDLGALVAQQRNVVLQSPNAPNDGSLSIYLRQGRYINIEAMRPPQTRTAQQTQSIETTMGVGVLQHLGVLPPGVTSASIGGCPLIGVNPDCPNCANLSCP